MFHVLRINLCYFIISWSLRILLLEAVDIKSEDLNGSPPAFIDNHNEILRLTASPPQSSASALRGRFSAAAPEGPSVDRSGAQCSGQNSEAAPLPYERVCMLMFPETVRAIEMFATSICEAFDINVHTEDDIRQVISKPLGMRGSLPAEVKPPFPGQMMK